jgi:protoporphyrinogen oxidase
VSTSGVRRVAVVGGGVTGLTVAYRLMQVEADVVVLEAGPAAGGKLGTATVGDLELPAGADSFLARKPWAVALCKELGIDLETPGATGAYLWTDTGLVPLLKDAPFGIPGSREPASAGRRRTSCVARARATMTSRSGHCCAGVSATRRPTSRWARCSRDCTRATSTD